MPSGSLDDSALILAGHGATRNSDSVAPVYAHAAELRSRRIFREVLECFWMVEPHLSKVWSRVSASTVYVVPITVSDGYFTTEVIPTQLGLRTLDQCLSPGPQLHQDRQVHYCRPVGTHPSMTDALLARAETVVREHPSSPPPNPTTTTLFIAGHGTPRNRESRVAVERQVALIRARAVYADVQPAFMLEEPLIADCWKIARTPDLIMVPFFISDGMHTAEDIPVLLGESESTIRKRREEGRPVWSNPTRRGAQRLFYTSAIGTEPHLAQVILDLVREARDLGR